MEKKIKLNNIIDSRDSYLIYEEEKICPICKANISPKFISSVLHKNLSGNPHVSIHNYCTGCSSAFITDYDVYLSSKSSSAYDYYYVTCVVSSEPNRFKEKLFDEHINNLSPSFVKIYNQALAAECSGLDEIAGLGYRKALEFLIKDFSTSEHKDEEEKIKSMPLSACIKNYIDDPRIKILAEKSAWIGNDEAHYIRKQENRDVSDMKNFITATVYFISMVLITKDAETIFPK